MYKRQQQDFGCIVQGFQLGLDLVQVGDRVFDNSGRHALDQMTGDKPDLATLKTRVEDYKPAANTAEGGTVVSAADRCV